MGLDPQLQPDSQETSQKAYICPRCCEQELEIGPKWAQCPGCGAGFLASDLEAIESRADSLAKSREARACFLEETRRCQKRGGGNDGLSMVPDYGWSDSSLVKVATRRVSRRGSVLRVRNCDASPAEAMAALEEFFARHRHSLVEG